MRHRRSRGLLICLTVAVCLASLCAASADAQTTSQGLQYQKDESQLRLTIDGKQIGQFVFRDARIRRPYFANLTLPDGVKLTRNHPPVAGIDAMDHDTMHPGVWLAFGDICGVDFWRNKGSIEHQRFVVEPHTESGKLSFETESHFVDESGKVIGLLLSKISVSAEEQGTTSGWMIVWDATIRADRQPLTLGDQEEMGFGARVATDITEKKGGRILNSNALTTAAKTWGQPAQWCDYSGEVDGRTVGLTLLTDPKNSYSSWWHNRDYGLMVANPFGRKAMKQGEKSEITIQEGQRLRLRFGAYIHSGSTDDYSSLLTRLVP